MRGLLVAVAVLLVLPAFPASAVVPIGDLPMRFLGDLSLAVLPSRGTQDDPYLIEGKRFFIPEATSRVPQFPTGVDLLSGIVIEDTSAFIIIRHNQFAATGNAAPVIQGTASAIRLLNASHVTIEENQLSGIGSGWVFPSVEVRNSRDVTIRDNIAHIRGPFIVEHSTIDINRNRILALQGFALDDFALNVGGSAGAIADNTFASIVIGMNAESPGQLRVQGNRISGYASFAQQVGAPTLTVNENQIKGEVSLGGALIFAGNTIDECFQCLTVSYPAPRATVSNNLVEGLPILLIDEASNIVATSPGPIGWLGVYNSTGVTLSNIQLPSTNRRLIWWNVENLTIRDSLLASEVVGAIVGELMLVRTHFGRAEFGPHGPITSIRATDIVSDHGLFIVGSFDFSIPAPPIVIERAEVGTTTVAGGSFAYPALAVGNIGCAQVTISDVNILGEKSSISIGQFCQDASKTRLRNVAMPADAEFWADGGHIDARNNWWGSADGPRLEGTNAGGARLRGFAADKILFDPWLTSPRRERRRGGSLTS